MECFLCEAGKCFLGSMYKNNVYTSLFPDLDENCKKPLHILVAPKNHYESISEMSEMEYCIFMIAVRKVQEFYLEKGYGPAVAELRSSSRTAHQACSCPSCFFQ